MICTSLCITAHQQARLRQANPKPSCMGSAKTKSVGGYHPPLVRAEYGCAKVSEDNSNQQRCGMRSTIIKPLLWQISTAASRNNALQLCVLGPIDRRSICRTNEDEESGNHLLCADKAALGQDQHPSNTISYLSQSLRNCGGTALFV